MEKGKMPLLTLVRSIATSLGIDELSETELTTISGAIEDLFGFEITAVGVGVANQIHHLLPRDQLSRDESRERILGTKLLVGDHFSVVLNALIGLLTASVGAKRADDLAVVFYWVSEGLEKAPHFAAKMVIA
jgi:hypothetical protein